MKYILRLVLMFLLGSSLFFAPKVSAAISYNGGEYTNLNGSGTSAQFHTGTHCNLSSGSCSGPSVVKFTCNGRGTQCTDNETSFSSSQSIGNPGCGKTVQLDVFNKQCRVNGGWDSSCQLLDYVVWYSGDCSTPPETPPTESCEDHRPINTQFRKAGNGAWISGDELTTLKLQAGQKIDVNCFAKNGTALLPDSVMDVRKPNGATERVKDGPELRNYEVTQSGSYRFTCSSTKFNYCYDGDSFRIEKGVIPSPVPSPVPTPTPTPEHKSRCVNLDVTGGNNQTVPAQVTLRATGEDSSQTGIQRYRFFFGDGSQQETDQRELTHKYESSGKFIAQVEVKDSKGNWITSDNCEKTVTVKSSPIESHKASCSNLYVVSRSNDAKAPSTVKLKVSGYDNKADIKSYKIDFGDGETKESDNRTFEHEYDTAGTYLAKAYIQDSKGDWHGGESRCRTNVYVETKPLTKQPDTGTPTAFSIIGIVSGGMSGAFYFLRRKLVR